MQILHEDTFYEYFKPYRPKNAGPPIWGGLGLEVFGNDPRIVMAMPPANVWTVVEGENNSQGISPGMHVVNRLCFLVTQIPHNGIDVDFNATPRNAFLSPIGLRRQLATLRRLISRQQELLASQSRNVE